MILVTGALGQIGFDLIQELGAKHGPEKILATDLRPPQQSLPDGVEFKKLDVTDVKSVNAILDEFQFHTVYHLAGILSARGEESPDLCWNVNVNGLEIMLKAARTRHFRIFWPSSIAVFGPKTQKVLTPQSASTDPHTMYGTSKAAGELLCRYYFTKFGVDVRSIRFPGVISHASPPGGGTTDWAVDMFFQATKNGSYDCFLTEGTRLPMMYMPDAVKSVLDLMNADESRLTVRTSYNLTAFSFSPSELSTLIRSSIPEFQTSYSPDFRQDIAETWPESIDDSVARKDWSWNPAFDLQSMVDDMLDQVRIKLGGIASSPDSANKII